MISPKRWITYTVAQTQEPAWLTPNKTPLAPNDPAILKMAPKTPVLRLTGTIKAKNGVSEKTLSSDTLVIDAAHYRIGHEADAPADARKSNFVPGTGNVLTVTLPSFRAGKQRKEKVYDPKSASVTALTSFFAPKPAPTPDPAPTAPKS